MLETYDASHITVLEGLQPVRERPAMYIGSTDTRGLHHLVYEVVDNSVDEALGGFCDHIWVAINEDGSCRVEDNGRGIPVDRVKKTGKSAIETVLTVLHAGGKFDKDLRGWAGSTASVFVLNTLSGGPRHGLPRRERVQMHFVRGKAAPLVTREETKEEMQARYAVPYSENGRRRAGAARGFHRGPRQGDVRGL